MSKSVEEVAHQITEAIHEDLADRSGVLDGIDADTIEEIMETHKKIIVSALSIQQEADAKWLPISMLPNTGMKMFVVIAIDVQIGTSRYTSDPYCVWHTNGVFERWPHQYKPTHFKLLPETAMATPTDSEAKTSA